MNWLNFIVNLFRKPRRITYLTQVTVHVDEQSIHWIYRVEYCQCCGETKRIPAGCVVTEGDTWLTEQTACRVGTN